MRKNTFLFATFLILLGTALISSVYTQGEPAAELSASPDNSNIFHVSGSGFNVSETVWLRLVSDEIIVLNFTETIESDVEGNFSAIVFVPAKIHGTHNLTALTSNVTVLFEYSVLDLTGPKGDPEDPTIDYSGIRLGLVAIVLSVYALARKSSAIRLKRSKSSISFWVAMKKPLYYRRFWFFKNFPK